VSARRDEELLADHLAGVPGAFDALAERYADDLYRFLVRFVGNATAADDLVQETFLQVFSAASEFDPDRTFKPWLYTIAANKGRDYLRSRGRRQESSLDASGPDEDRPTGADVLAAEELPSGTSLDAEEQRQRVRAVIARMPEHLRLMLVLGYYEQLPYAQIAEIVGIPVGTVKSRLHAAVTHFARAWQARDPSRERRRV
jgi:RNA polymerase sigma-70 factor (ECF subfamily)